MERGVILSHDSVLQPHHFEMQRTAQIHPLAQQLNGAKIGAMHAATSNRSTTPPGGVVLSTLNVAEAEWALIQRALELTKNNRTKTAELLGISVRTLRNKLNGTKSEKPEGDEEE
jgi:DNA-binding NtrC family response regulator